MADKVARRTIVRATTHPSDSRPSIPTAELESLARPEEKRPATVRYPRDPTLDPQLVWRGKDEQDAHDLEVPAIPIYIGETIDPLALVEEPRADGDSSGGNFRLVRGGGLVDGDVERILRHIEVKRDDIPRHLAAALADHTVRSGIGHSSAMQYLETLAGVG